MKNFINGLLEFIGSISNFAFYAIQLYILLFFFYVLLYPFVPDLVGFLTPLYIDFAKTPSDIGSNITPMIIFGVFSLMFVFLKNFITIRYDNFVTNLLNQFDYIGAQLSLKEGFNLANNKKKFLDELKFVIFTKINCEIYKSFFDEENEKSEEEIIEIKSNILKEISNCLSGYTVLKSANSNDLFAAVIMDFNKFSEIIAKLNIIKQKILKQNNSNNIKIELTIVCDMFNEDDDFHKKVFYINKIPKLIKKSVFVATTELENSLNLNEEIKNNFAFDPIGTYSLSDENEVSKDFDLSIMKIKNI